jgi:hypothetical protein
MSTVQKGDQVTFSAEPKTEQTIEWSQSLSSRKEIYYVFAAQNASRGTYTLDSTHFILSER